MLPAESSAEPGQWRTSRAEYLRGIMDAVSSPLIETIVFKKSSQVGASEVMVNGVGYFIDHDPSPQLMFQPRHVDAEDFSKDRIAPTIRDTPCLRGKVSDPKSRDSGNTILHKNYPGGKLVIGTAESPAGLSSHSVRVVWFDEVDRYPRSAGTEGDPIDLGVTRTNNYWNRKIFLGSSPKTKLLSRIEPAFLESDQRYFFIPCPHCQQPQRLVFDNFEYDEGMPETARMKCVSCLKPITTAQRDYAVRSCAPMENETIPLGKDMQPLGWRATAPFHGTAGFHISALYSPWVSFEQIARKWEKAKDVPERKQVFINTVLGEVFEELADEFDWAVLQARAENYEALVPAGVLALFAGIDVQPDRLECEILGSDEKDETWNIDYYVIHGDPDIGAGKPNSPWDELLNIIRERRYRHAYGHDLQVYATCIDSGGKNTSAVYDFCKGRRAQRIFAIKGVAGEDKPIAGTPNRKKTGKSKRAVDLYPIGVDQAKATLYRRFRVTEPGKPGYCHFPKTRDEDYFRQVTAESVVTTYVRGFPRRVWTLPSGQRNEALDCRVYALAAIAIVRPPWDRFIAQRDARRPKEPVANIPLSGELTTEPVPLPLAASVDLARLETLSQNTETALPPKAPVRRKWRSNFVNTW